MDTAILSVAAVTLVAAAIAAVVPWRAWIMQQRERKIEHVAQAVRAFAGARYHAGLYRATARDALKKVPGWAYPDIRRFVNSDDDVRNAAGVIAKLDAERISALERWVT